MLISEVVLRRLIAEFFLVWVLVHSHTRVWSGKLLIDLLQGRVLAGKVLPGHLLRTTIVCNVCVCVGNISDSAHVPQRVWVARNCPRGCCDVVVSSFGVGVLDFVHVVEVALGANDAVARVGAAVRHRSQL